MKKLFIGFAVAAFSGFVAVADICSEKPAVECPFAYRVKVMVRTTGANKANDGCSVVCYRQKSLRRFVGFVYGNTGTVAVEGKCGDGKACGCNGWNDAKLVVWDYDTREAVEVIDAKIPVLGMLADGNGSEIEVSATVDGMNFSGFGYVGTRDGYKTVASAQGYCAGTILGGKCVNCVTCGDIVPAKGWNLCGGVEQTDETAACGKWIMQYDGAAASRYGAGHSLLSIGSGWEPGLPVGITR